MIYTLVSPSTLDFSQIFKILLCPEKQSHNFTKGRTRTRTRASVMYYRRFNTELCIYIHWNINRVKLTQLFHVGGHYIQVHLVLEILLLLSYQVSFIHTCCLWLRVSFLSVLLWWNDFNVFNLFKRLYFIHKSARLLSKGVFLSKSQSLGRTITYFGQLRLAGNDKNHTKLNLNVPTLYIFLLFLSIESYLSSVAYL